MLKRIRGIGLLEFRINHLTLQRVAKVVVFGSAVNANLTWLALIGVVNTVIAAYYYLRVIRAIVFEDPADESTFSADKPVLVAAGVAAVGAGVFGLAPFLLLEFAENALSIIPGL